MAKTKRYYAERVRLRILNQYPNPDFKIQEREIFLTIDDVVNALARKAYFDNWKISGTGIDEQFITTWDGDNAIAVVDQNDEKPSYFEFPCNYADLPRNGGIIEVWAQKYNTVNHSVVIQTHQDVRLYASNMAGGLQGRLSGYPQGNRFYFSNPKNGCNIKKKYGNMGLRLVIRDSSLISDSAVYPIPADKEDFVVETVVERYIEKRMQPQDKVRDTNDQP